MKISSLPNFIKKAVGLNVDNNTNTENTAKAIWLSKGAKQAISSISAVNKEKTLYEMECGDYYYGKSVLTLMKLMGFYRGGCSAFITEEGKDHFIIGRNYDFPHLDENGKMSGLNVLIRCNPKNRYRSIAVSDAAWLHEIDKNFHLGCLDDHKTDLSLCALLPYICMDGINEKGLCVSILILDKKNNEDVDQKEEGKTTMVHTILMRYLLDNCKDVDEAVEYTRKVNVKGPFGLNFHIFVTDQNGNSVVLEWREQKLFVTKTNATTNFYLSFEDAEDFYRDGVFTEKFETYKDSILTYHYGYGHGYGRFNHLIETLDAHSNKDKENYRTEMSREEVRNLLSEVAQKHTMYSAIYDSRNLSVDLYILTDYSKKYSFSLKNETI